MKTIGYGVIGWGFMGRTHAQSARNVPLYYKGLDFRPELLRQVPNILSEIPGGAEYRDVVCLADVSGRTCELYHDLAREHILLRL